MNLTKSNYLSGLQCPKLLWITKHDKEKLPGPSQIDKAKFEEGYLIEEFAKSLFPEGIDLSKLNFKEQLEKTKELLEKRVPLFEASFLINGLYSRADILFPVENNQWDILEIKSATKIKDVNFDDLAFQKYVYEKAGLKMRRCFIVHVNSEYVRQGEIEPKEFILQTDVTDKITEQSLGIEKRVNNMLNIINSKE